MLLLTDKFRNTRIILASKSPRRQFLLGGLGIEFDVINDFNVDESYPSSLKKNQIPVYLAIRKSEALYYVLKDNTILITADTIVCCDNRVMDKPAGREDAIMTLKELSGRKHQVISGVCLKSVKKTISFYSLTTVYFRNLHNDEIIYYVDNYKPFDKAGAYGIQEWIGYTGIKKIEGSYFNVMGLPVTELYENLVKF